MAFRAVIVLGLETLFGLAGQRLGLSGALLPHGPAQALTYYFQSDAIIPENRRH